MNCPHCGAEVLPGHRFCQQCRKRVAADPVPAATVPGAVVAPELQASVRTRPQAVRAAAPQEFQRPTAVTVLAVLNLVGGGFAVLGSLAVGFVLAGLSGPHAPEAPSPTVAVALCAVYLVIGVLQLATGVGLLKLAPWGRTLQIVGACIGLLGIPCGTIISIVILVYMLKPEVRTLFSGVPPRQLPPEEVARVQALAQGAGGAVAAVIAVVVVGVLAVGVIGIVAAIAIPSLLRARATANEAAAIGDLRAVVSGQVAYASANNGFYDELECLVAPAHCVPSYPEKGPVFIDRTMLQPLRHGYRFEFTPGARAQQEVLDRGEVSPTSLEGWTYVARPAQPGQTGIRAFCADASGRVCALPGELEASAGTCPEDCLTLP